MNLSRPSRSARRASAPAAAAVLLAAALAACGGGGDAGDAGDAPDDASQDDFCVAYADIIGVQDGADIRAWADALADVGTPEGLSEEERRGFEVLLETASDVPEDAALEDIQDPEMSAEDEAAGQAFGTYAQEACGEQIQEQLTEQAPELDLEEPAAPEGESTE